MFCMYKNYQTKKSRVGKTEITINKGYLPDHKEILPILFINESMVKLKSKLSTIEDCLTLSIDKKTYAEKILFIKNKSLTKEKLELEFQRLKELNNLEFTYIDNNGEEITVRIFDELHLNLETLTLTLKVSKEFAIFCIENPISVPKPAKVFGGKAAVLFNYLNQHNGKKAYSIEKFKHFLGFNQCNKRYYIEIKSLLEKLQVIKRRNGCHPVLKVVYTADLTIYVSTKKKLKESFNQNLIENVHVIEQLESVKKKSVKVEGETVELSQNISIGFKKNEILTNTVKNLIVYVEAGEVNYNKLYNLMKKIKFERTKPSKKKGCITVDAFFKQRAEENKIVQFDTFDDLEFDDLTVENNDMVIETDERYEIDREVAAREQEYENDQRAERQKEEQQFAAVHSSKEIQFDDSIPF